MTGCYFQRTKLFVVPSVGGATSFVNLRRKISKTQKKTAAELCQILRMVTIEIVVNSTRVMSIRVTISYRYCITFEVMLSFLVYFVICLSLFESGALCVRGVHCSNNHCVAVYGSNLMRFSTKFFQMGLSFQVHYIVLIFVVKWRHKFREITVKNCKKSKNRRKSLCAPLRIET